MRETNLEYAHLRDACLQGIFLRDAYLKGADLRNADLKGASFKDADIRFADLYGADLRYADLKSAKTDFGTLKNLLYISDIGCNNDIAEIYNTDKGIFIKCGCFQDTIEKFESQVKETYPGSKFEKDYLAMIEFIKRKFENLNI